MFKMMGFVGVGIVGTGLYFGGIQAMVNWRGEPAQAVIERTEFELIQEEGANHQVSDLIAHREPGRAVQRMDSEGQIVRLQAREARPLADSREGADTSKKIDFKMTSTPQDSIVTISYTVPATEASDSTHIDTAVFDLSGLLVMQPVHQMVKAGNHTVVMDKRGLPNGIYFVGLMPHHDKNLRIIRKLLVRREGRTQ